MPLIFAKENEVLQQKKLNGAEINKIANKKNESQKKN